MFCGCCGILSDNFRVFFWLKTTAGSIDAAASFCAFRSVLYKYLAYLCVIVAVYRVCVLFAIAFIRQVII